MSRHGDWREIGAQMPLMIVQSCSVCLAHDIATKLWAALSRRHRRGRGRPRSKYARHVAVVELAASSKDSAQTVRGQTVAKEMEKDSRGSVGRQGLVPGLGGLKTRHVLIAMRKQGGTDQQSSRTVSGLLLCAPHWRHWGAR